MVRSRLRNNFLKNKTEESKKLYNKQRNLCVSLLRKTKRAYFSQLDIKIVNDNRKFWKTINPLFSEKAYRKESISLIENDKLITNDKTLAETFNNFFSNIVKNIKVDDKQNITWST